MWCGLPFTRPATSAEITLAGVLGMTVPVAGQAVTTTVTAAGLRHRTLTADGGPRFDPDAGTGDDFDPTLNPE